VAVILRAADRVAVPWKNGGGVTREVAVHPPGADLGSFDWRVGVAEVHAAGPFSAFPGVERQMAVLAGRLLLAIEGEDTLSLSPESPPLRFAGDVRTFAQPVDAPVTDLNVMTRRDRFSARLMRRTVHHSRRLAAPGGTTLLLALSELTLRVNGGDAPLAWLDAALLDDAPCEVLAGTPGEAGEGGGSFYLVKIQPGTSQEGSQ
jgi:environmental stress-induced protein Ves